MTAALRLQPALKLSEANALANALARNPCGLPWQILLSIAFHESSLRKHTVGRLNPRTKDYGLFQINERNLLRYGLARDRLMTDERYSVAAACTILSENRKRYGRRAYWLGLYRSGTALWKADVVRSAKAYDYKVRKTAARLSTSQIEVASE